MADGALILVTGHHKVEDDKRGKAEEGDHADQGKPVHLPENESDIQYEAREGTSYFRSNPREQIIHMNSQLMFL